jgi:ATP-dependent DNA ligase
VDSATGRALEDRRAVLTARMNGDLSRQLFARYILEDIEQLQGAYESYCRRISEMVVIKTQVWQSTQTNPHR